MDWNGNTLKVMGKGRKQRVLPMGEKLPQALRAYLDHRAGVATHDDLLFLTKRGGPLRKDRAQHIIYAIGRRASVRGVSVSPHRFRHTFARLWVLNGGDPFTLQRLLGHTTMEMVRRYVSMAEEDLCRQHMKFNPGDRL